MPQINGVAIRHALKLVQNAKASRETLQANIAQFRQGAKRIGLNLWQSETAIQPIMIGDSETALQWSKHLKTLGFWITAFVHPPFPKIKLVFV